MDTHTYELQLPHNLRILHPVFYVSYLRQATNDPLLGQYLEPPPPIKINQEREWEVEEILDSRWHGRGRNKRLQYIVKWRGYNDDRTFYDTNRFGHAQEIIEEFYKTHPDKPR
jgi:hypothetical protein